MSRVFVRQVQVVPLTALLMMILTGLLMPGYSSASQHMSELGLLEHPAARVIHVAAVVGGTSILLFGIGLALTPSERLRFSAGAAMIFGIAYAAAGVFHSGPLHGLYGATMSYVLVPVLFAAELSDRRRAPFILRVSLWAGVLSLLYMWFMFSGLEPQSVRGVSQRIGALIIFGWYPLASHWLLRPSAVESDNAHQGSVDATR